MQDRLVNMYLPGIITAYTSDHPRVKEMKEGKMVI